MAVNRKVYSLQSVEKGHSKEWLFCVKYGIIEVEKM